MADERNVAHDKNVAADKGKAAGGGVNSAANGDGDGRYTTEHPAKHPPKAGEKPPQGDDDAAEEENTRVG